MGRLAAATLLRPRLRLHIDPRTPAAPRGPPRLHTRAGRFRLGPNRKAPPRVCEEGQPTTGSPVPPVPAPYPHSPRRASSAKTASSLAPSQTSSALWSSQRSACHRPSYAVRRATVSPPGRYRQALTRRQPEGRPGPTSAPCSPPRPTTRPADSAPLLSEDPDPAALSTEAPTPSPAAPFFAALLGEDIDGAAVSTEAPADAAPPAKSDRCPLTAHPRRARPAQPAATPAPRARSSSAPPAAAC